MCSSLWQIEWAHQHTRPHTKTCKKRSANRGVKDKKMEDRHREENRGFDLMFASKYFQIRIKIDALAVCMSRFGFWSSIVFSVHMQLIYIYTAVPHIGWNLWFCCAKMSAPYFSSLYWIGDMKSHINRLIDIETRVSFYLDMFSFSPRTDIIYKRIECCRVILLKLKVTRFGCE